MKKRFLEAGKIVRTHGVRGELCLEPWADSPEFLCQVKDFYFDSQGRQPAGLKAARVHKGRLLITLRGVETIEQGDLLRGKVLYLDREDIAMEEGRYFLQDLLGLKAIDGETGQNYGTVAEIISAPANDVYRIVNGEEEYLFPAVKHMLKRIDPEAGVIELLPIPGIFDNDGEET